MSDPSGAQILADDECFELLASATLGRVVFTARGLPAVQPVRFHYHERAVYFPAQAGTELFGAAQDGVVAFEVDAFDDTLTAGWWVTALGRAQAAEAPGGSASLPRLAWHDKPGLRWVRIPVEVVSGRRVNR